MDLQAQLEATMDEEDVTFDQAFNKVALRYLGFDEADGELSDGKGDHGVDF